LRYLVGETVLGVKLVEDADHKVNRTMPVLVFVTKVVDEAKPHAELLKECNEECRRVHRDILGPLLAPSGRAYRAVPLVLNWDAPEHQEHVRSTVRGGINWMLRVRSK